MEAGDAGIYDWVQVDSDVERKFIENYLSDNDPKLIGYFKFPPSLQNEPTKVIGNYNPDWGILRFDDEGRVDPQIDPGDKGEGRSNLLRFSNEGRKIEAAKRHFKTLSLDYRVVTDSTNDWYEPDRCKGTARTRASL